MMAGGRGRCIAGPETEKAEAYRVPSARTQPASITLGRSVYCDNAGQQNPAQQTPESAVLPHATTPLSLGSSSVRWDSCVPSKVTQRDDLRENIFQL